MWWKLGGLLVVTAVLVLLVIPIRTHARAYDPMNDQPPASPSLSDLLRHMYVTPGSAVVILVILGLAAFVAMKVVRREW